MITRRIQGSASRGVAPLLAALAAVLASSAGNVRAQDTCDVTFQLDDPGPLGLVMFSVDYSSAGGDFVGDSTLPGFGPSWGTEPLACASLVTVDELTALDDNVGLLGVFAASLGGTLAGPVPIVSCVLALDSGFPCPDAADFAIVDAIWPNDPFPPPFPIPPAPAITVSVSPRTPLCGDDFREGLEECDDGNTSDGDCCSSSCTLDTAATPCDDGSVCTDAEACDGNGACIPGSTLSCDDGLPCTFDVCDPLAGCQALDEPDHSCQPLTRAKLLIKDRPGASPADRVVVKAKLHDGVIGDPSAATEYSLCVFDRTLGVHANALQLDVPAGPPWAPRGASGSFGYVDPARSSDGVEKVRLSQNASGNGSFLLIGKGSGLPLPGPVGPAYLSADPGVTVQIENTAGSCWKARLETVRNDAEGFLGRR